MEYRIRLEQMEFHAYHGCYELERKVGNRFAVEVELTAEMGRVAADDDVTQAVNYLTVYEVVRAEMAATQHTLERVASNIIDALYRSFPQLRGVRCSVAKLAPPLGGKVGRVSVVLER